MTLLQINPDILRLVSFLSIFVLLAMAEKAWPRRPLTVSKPKRWLGNMSLVTMNALLLRLISPIAPFTMAALAQSHGWGLFNLFQFSGYLETTVSILLLDILIYTQHRLFHRIPLFWRIHRMHHTDIDLDVSSGTRFHPLEMILSLAIKLMAVVLLGISPLSVLLFEILLNATSMFSHANLRIPSVIDQWVRLLLVTPDMHRVHHSVIVRETNSNFSFNLSCWDRVFSTYHAQPRDGHDQMSIGLMEWRNLRKLGLWSLLMIPFINSTIRSEP